MPEKEDGENVFGAKVLHKVTAGMIASACAKNHTAAIPPANMADQD